MSSYTDDAETIGNDYGHDGYYHRRTTPSGGMLIPHPKRHGTGFFFASLHLSHAHTHTHTQTCFVPPPKRRRSASSSSLSDDLYYYDERSRRPQPYGGSGGGTSSSPFARPPPQPGPWPRITARPYPPAWELQPGERGFNAYVQGLIRQANLPMVLACSRGDGKGQQQQQQQDQWYQSILRYLVHPATPIQRLLVVGGFACGKTKTRKKSERSGSGVAVGSREDTRNDPRARKLHARSTRRPPPSSGKKNTTTHPSLLLSPTYIYIGMTSEEDGGSGLTDDQKSSFFRRNHWSPPFVRGPYVCVCALTHGIA